MAKGAAGFRTDIEFRDKTIALLKDYSFEPEQQAFVPQQAGLGMFLGG